MIALIQRVASASVRISGLTHSHISEGLLIFLGIYAEDTTSDAHKLAHRIAEMSIFKDAQSATLKSASALHKEALVVSQFTLCASTKKGRKPSFSAAAKATIAEPLYNSFIKYLKADLGETQVQCGVFGADMEVSICNTGPYTLIIDT